MGETPLPYTTEDRDRILTLEHDYKKVAEIPESLSALKENVVKLTSLQERIIDDANRRDVQWAELMRQSDNQWNSINKIINRMDVAFANQENTNNSLLERLEKTDKALLNIEKVNQEAHNIILDQMNKRYCQDDQQEADYKKQKLASKWATWAVLGAALITGVVSLILAIINRAG